MQSNLDVYSLAGRTIAFPALRSQGKTPSTNRLVPSTDLVRGVECISGSASISAGEQLAWLVTALSALAAIVAVFWF